jgi:hypothetical protein
MVSWGQAASAEETPLTSAKVEGWTIAPMADGTACLASGSSESGSILRLGAKGKVFVMLIVAPDLPTNQVNVPATLSFDDRPPEAVVARGLGGAMGFVIAPREPTWRLMTSKTVAVTVAGLTHSFLLSNVAPAMDALARCVGQPTIAERTDRPDRPIPGGGAWRLAVTLPNIPRSVCQARVRGEQIDNMLSMSPNGRIVALLAAHWDWPGWGNAAVPVQLSIDGDAPIRLQADPLDDNQILIVLKETALLRRLRAARTLDWTLPTGHAHIDVTGLGVAQDAVWACLSHGVGG